MNLYSSPFFILTVAIGKTIYFQEISFISCIGKTKFLYFLPTVSLFVMDCGSEIGNAAGYNRQLAAQKRLQYMGTAQIIMPENFI